MACNIKRKRVNLSIKQKLELIEKLESGVSVARVCELYGVKKQTVSDIRKNKEKLVHFSLKYSVGDSKSGFSVADRKHVKVAQNKNLEEAVYKWFVQQRSSGVVVRSVELRAAAEKLAKHMGLETFRASDGWLWRFRKRHGFTNRKTCGESLSADIEQVEPFRKKIKKLIESEGLLLCQLYNAEETGLYFRSVPENTLAYKHDAQTPGRKLNKERISALLCANADGSHRLKPMVVGKARKPRALKNISMQQLPVIYSSSKNAWFTGDIFSDWFFNQFVPAVRHYQEEVMKIPSHEVKALLLLDNAPCHPNAEKLVSRDGRIKCDFLPPNTTSLIQPMDQGVIVACKRIYKKKFLEEVMVVLENENDAVEDLRGARTLQNLRTYNLKSAIFNFAAAWREMKVSTLANGWSKLLNDADPEYDFTGFEISDFRSTIMEAGDDIPEKDIEQWLENDEADPGYQILNEEEIAESILHDDNEDEVEDDKKEELSEFRPKLSTVREHMDDVITYIGASSDPEVFAYYEHFRQFRALIIKKQHSSGKQLKLDAFFQSSSMEQP